MSQKCTLWQHKSVHFQLSKVYTFASLKCTL
nr:MAG TPA: hypothetical protein [Caudoviricetes sp.]